MKPMDIQDKTVTVVAVLSTENWLEQLIIINSNMESCGYESVELILVGCNDEHIPKKYLHPLAKISDAYTRDKPITSILNPFAALLHNDFLVVMAVDTYLPKNWLQTAMHEFSQIETLGLYIIQSTPKFYFQKFLDKTDNLVDCYVPKLGYEQGTIILPKTSIHKAGAFNENLYSQWWICDYADRLSKMSLYTLCTNQFSIKITLDHFDQYFHANFHDYLDLKGNSEFLPFHNEPQKKIDISHQEAIDFSEQCGLVLCVFNPTQGIVYKCKSLSDNQLLQLTEFCSKQSLIPTINQSVSNIIIVLTKR